MNKEFSQIVSIYLESQVDSIIDNNIIPNDGQKPIMVFSQPFDIDNKVTSSTASPLMQSSVRLIIDKLSPENYKTLASSRRVFLKFETNYNNRIMGVKGFPAFISVTPDINQDTIEAVAKVPLSRYR